MVIYSSVDLFFDENYYIEHTEDNEGHLKGYWLGFLLSFSTMYMGMISLTQGFYVNLFSVVGFVFIVKKIRHTSRMEHKKIQDVNLKTIKI